MDMWSESRGFVEYSLWHVSLQPRAMPCLIYRISLYNFPGVCNDVQYSKYISNLNVKFTFCYSTCMDRFSFQATDKRKRTQFRGHCVFIWKNNTVASLYSLWLATVTSSCPCSVVSAPEFAVSQLVTLYFTACRKIRITGRRFCRPRWILFVAMNIWSDAGGIVVNTPHLLFLYIFCLQKTNTWKQILPLHALSGCCDRELLCSHNMNYFKINYFINFDWTVLQRGKGTGVRVKPRGAWNSRL